MQGRSSYPRPDKTLPLKIVSLKTSPSDNNNFLRCSRSAGSTSTYSASTATAAAAPGATATAAAAPGATAKGVAAGGGGQWYEPRAKMEHVLLLTKGCLTVQFEGDAFAFFRCPRLKPIYPRRTTFTYKFHTS
jgi:uncharacterized C2H2 Zn-finger protein